jgi:hypothetical protein
MTAQAGPYSKSVVLQFVLLFLLLPVLLKAVVAPEGAQPLFYACRQSA